MNNPFTRFLAQQRFLILDGGLATQLEAHGANLADHLWSARLLQDDPDLIRQVHLDYFWAGADCAITATYQATIEGFLRWGVDGEQTAVSLLQSAVTLAHQARQQFWQHNTDPQRLYPLIAASIGPYGAYLANGAEYTGHYDLDIDGLIAFHRPRWHSLTQTQADLLACETIPSYQEAQAIKILLNEGNMPAYVSFSCRDEQHINDGTPIEQCITLFEDTPQVIAIGINCTAPRYIPTLIQKIFHHTNKPIIVYPNSGETYNASTHQWSGENIPSHFGTYSREWRKAGAAIIGGCCRTTPAHIRQIRDRFKNKS